MLDQGWGSNSRTNFTPPPRRLNGVSTQHCIIKLVSSGRRQFCVWRDTDDGRQHSEMLGLKAMPYNGKNILGRSEVIFCWANEPKGGLQLKLLSSSIPGFWRAVNVSLAHTIAPLEFRWKRIEKIPILCYILRRKRYDPVLFYVFCLDDQ